MIRGIIYGFVAMVLVSMAGGDAGVGFLVGGAAFFIGFAVTSIRRNTRRDDCPYRWWW